MKFTDFTSTLTPWDWDNAFPEKPALIETMSARMFLEHVYNAWSHELLSQLIVEFNDDSPDMSQKLSPGEQLYEHMKGVYELAQSKGMDAEGDEEENEDPQEADEEDEEDDNAVIEAFNQNARKHFLKYFKSTKKS
jgi:hypothetical protein